VLELCRSLTPAEQLIAWSAVGDGPTAVREVSRLYGVQTADKPDTL
jgi:hypothetical protein